jgi:histidyl-tRNA synthetase
LPKLSEADRLKKAKQLGISRAEAEFIIAAVENPLDLDNPDFVYRFDPSTKVPGTVGAEKWLNPASELKSLLSVLSTMGVSEWCGLDASIVRGLAYYTDMVFEVHEVSGAERAIAGGGRYDNLVELFGGPPTPAVGFAMGDVVLSLVLQDKGLMPEGKALLDKIDARPDVFVISNGKDDSEAALKPSVAALRRAGLHARHTYRTTRNVGKLLKEAADSHARYAAIIENDREATLKNLDTGEQSPDPIALDALAAAITPRPRTSQGA